jgi:hypothetical protein
LNQKTIENCFLAAVASGIVRRASVVAAFWLAASATSECFADLQQPTLRRCRHGLRSVADHTKYNTLAGSFL